MWPKGWNAAWPGQPAPKRAKRAPQRVLHIDPSDAQELYQGLVDGIGSNAQETLDKIRNLEFSTARKIVQWKMKQGTRVQSCSRPGEAEVEAALRQRVKDKPKERSRQFIKFLYGSNDAWHLHLRDVLRNGSIHSLHPEPNVAAALRVCERYAPQVQSLLFNYTSAAREASSEDAVIDLQQPCACWQALRSRDANDRYLHEGHVCTTDLTALKWSYLQGFADKGRKFRLELPLEATLDDLKRAFVNYTTCAAQKQARRMGCSVDASGAFEFREGSATEQVQASFWIPWHEGTDR